MYVVGFLAFFVFQVGQSAEGVGGNLQVQIPAATFWADYTAYVPKFPPDMSEGRTKCPALTADEDAWRESCNIPWVSGKLACYHFICDAKPEYSVFKTASQDQMKKEAYRKTMCSEQRNMCLYIIYNNPENDQDGDASVQKGRDLVEKGSSWEKDTRTIFEQHVKENNFMLDASAKEMYVYSIRNGESWYTNTISGLPVLADVGQWRDLYLKLPETKAEGESEKDFKLREAVKQDNKNTKELMTNVMQQGKDAEVVMKQALLAHMKDGALLTTDFSALPKPVNNWRTDKEVGSGQYGSNNMPFALVGLLLLLLAFAMKVYGRSKQNDYPALLAEEV